MLELIFCTIVAKFKSALRPRETEKVQCKRRCTNQIILSYRDSALQPRYLRNDIFICLTTRLGAIKLLQLCQKVVSEADKA
jgi:hypothetical protein